MSSTIAAIVTPRGNAGVGVIRLSGPNALDISTNLTHQASQTIKPRYAHYVRMYDQKNRVVDDGLLLYFPAPNSFTGECVVELQGHGGHIVQNKVLKRLFALGAVQAQAGEFSQRAYLNDKLSLDQAEAIMSLINAASDQAARAAQQSLQGAFSKKINALSDQIHTFRIWVEAAIDFPEEEIDFLADATLHAKLNQIEQTFTSLLSNAKTGRVLSEGIKVAIIGEPNVGKSSLLNLLSEVETAIVSDIAGTTRDIVNASVLIDGLQLHFSDTAGLRETDDPIENEGIKRTWKAVEHAELLILIREASLTPAWAEWASEIPEKVPCIKIVNKIDLYPQIEVADDEWRLSTVTTEGLSEIRQAILRAVGYSSTEQLSGFSVRQRHILALESCSVYLQNARLMLQSKQGELLAEELKCAAADLESITGRVRLADEVLGDIFGKFCIGK